MLAPYSMKVAIGNKDLIAAEYEKLTSIDTSSLPVVQVERIFKHSTENCSGYLMSQVGQPIEQLDRTNKEATKKTVEDLFNSLDRLHNNGYAHGDPRLENAIRYEDSLLWIDFMDLNGGVAVNQYSKKLDFMILCKSIIHHVGMKFTKEEEEKLVPSCDVNVVIRAVVDNICDRMHID